MIDFDSDDGCQQKKKKVAANKPSADSRAMT
jgi:hypothetical protein